MDWRAGVLIGCLSVAACGRSMTPPQWQGFAGDAARGATIIKTAGCAQCHEVPGISGSVAAVGPPLVHFGSRTSVAGLLPNQPKSLVRWLRFPQSVLPGNAMPDTGLNEQQARDVAAYLHNLR